VDKRLLSESEESSNQQHRLVSILEAYEHEFYILQFRLQDLVSIDDQPCIQTIQLVLAIGTNETNQTVALDTAREYLEALRLTSKRSHSYFDLTLLNVILLFVLLSIAIVIALVGMKLVFLPPSSSSSSLSSLSLRHQRMRQQRKLRSNRNGNTTGGTLYCLQGPTETQLPLLENGPGEHSLTSSLIDGNMKMGQDETINHSIDNDVHADEQKQHLLSRFNQFSSSTVKNQNEFKTFALKSTNNPYDIIGYIHSNEQHCSSSSSSSSYNRVRDSGYETTSSIEQQQRQHFASPSSPSNVSLSPDGQTITVTYFSSPIPCHSDSLSSSLSSSNTITRTLKTFCQMPVTIASGNESSTMMNACLAEQEIIEL
ncbi:unnamed protein product, partial [Rotaria magnacalcarata]